MMERQCIVMKNNMVLSWEGELRDICLKGIRKNRKKTSQNISKVFGWMPTLHTFQKNAQAWWFKVQISPRIELHERSGWGYLGNPAYGGGVTPQHTMCFLSFKTSITSWCFRHHRAASNFFCFIVDPLCFLRPGWLVWELDISASTGRIFGIFATDHGNLRGQHHPMPGFRQEIAGSVTTLLRDTDG